MKKIVLKSIIISLFTFLVSATLSAQETTIEAAPIKEAIKEKPADAHGCKKACCAHAKDSKKSCEAKSEKKCCSTSADGAKKVCSKDKKECSKDKKSCSKEGKKCSKSDKKVAEACEKDCKKACCEKKA